jgi:hypothetical protein
MTYYTVYLEREPDGKPDAIFRDVEMARKWAYEHSLVYVSINPVRMSGVMPVTMPAGIEKEESGRASLY